MSTKLVFYFTAGLITAAVIDALILFRISCLVMNEAMLSTAILAYGQFVNDAWRCG